MDNNEKKVKVIKSFYLGDNEVEAGSFIYIRKDSSIRLESGEVVFPPSKTILREYTDYKD